MAMGAFQWVTRMHEGGAQGGVDLFSKLGLASSLKNAPTFVFDICPGGSFQGTLLRYHEHDIDERFSVPSSNQIGQRIDCLHENNRVASLRQTLVYGISRLDSLPASYVNPSWQTPSISRPNLILDLESIA